MRILILNSSPDTCEMLEAYFRLQGWEPFTCLLKQVRDTTLSGAALIASYQPSVIVIDVTIPYDANWSAVQGLRADPEVTCPIIVTTTNEGALRRLIGVEDDVVEIFSKPYDLDQLKHAMIVAVGGSDVTPLSRSDERRREERRVSDRRHRSTRG
jgi:DNA-binding response OmpR family regulator